MNAKKIIGYATGVTQVKNMAGDIRANFSAAGKIIGDTVQSARAASKAENIDWQEEPDRLFDQLCCESGTTTESVKISYLGLYLAAWGTLILGLWALWVVINHSSTHAIMSVTNIMLAGMILMISVVQEYKMYVAREQRAIHPARFLAMFIVTPSIWVPIWLPREYKLRIER
jgi:hypothetical protein